MDSAQTAIVAAIGVVFGVLVGSSISLAIAILNRKWARQDAHKTREIETLERRCSLAEEVAGTMVVAFYRLYTDCISYAARPSRRELEATARRLNQEAEARDLRLLAGAPAIISLRSELLKSTWSEMGDILGQMAGLNMETLRAAVSILRKARASEIQDAAGALKIRFNQKAANFYGDLDRIRRDAS